MEYFLFYVMLYVIIFGFYMLYFLITKKSKKEVLEVMYLKSKYKVNKPIKNIKLHIALVNSLIFIITIFVMSLFDNFIIKTLVAFASVMLLIIIFYKLLSILYNRKKWVMKYLILFMLLFSFTGCSKKTEEQLKYESYIEELIESNYSSIEDGPFDLSIYYDKILDNEIMYRLILDKPTELLKDVEVIVIHNYQTNDIFPSSGIFESKYTLNPEIIDIDNNNPKGIILVGYIDYEGEIDDLNIEFKVLIKYIDNNSNLIKHIFAVS